MLALLPSHAIAKVPSISLMVNGSYILEGSKPVIIDNSTYVPMRNLFENIDFTVQYYSKSKEALA